VLAGVAVVVGVADDCVAAAPLAFAAAASLAVVAGVALALAGTSDAAGGTLSGPAAPVVVGAGGVRGPSSGTPDSRSD
jgi:hypothetical protein